MEAEFISIRRSLKILIDTCFGLEHAHRQSILHRDIKPANIMVVGNRYKLSDFGLAKTNLAGSGAGTPVYLSGSNTSWAAEINNSRPNKPTLWNCSSFSAASSLLRISVTVRSTRTQPVGS